MLKRYKSLKIQVVIGNLDGLWATHLGHIVWINAVQVGGQDMLMFKYFLLFLVCFFLLLIALPVFVVSFLAIPVLLLAALIL